ncbi:hypothetical protein R6Z07M_018048 [Ovis aries]
MGRTAFPSESGARRRASPAAGGGIVGAARSGRGTPARAPLRRAFSLVPVLDFAEHLSVPHAARAPGPPPGPVGPPRRRSASPSGGIAARGAGWEVFDLAAPHRPALYGLGIEARELESGPKHLRGGLRLGFPETTACPFLAQEASGSARHGPLLVTALRTPGFWSLLSPELGMVALEQKGQATGTPAGPRRGPDQRLPAGSAQAPEWWRRLLGVALPRAPGTQHQELGSAGRLRSGRGRSRLACSPGAPPASEPRRHLQGTSQQARPRPPSGPDRTPGQAAERPRSPAVDTPGQPRPAPCARVPPSPRDAPPPTCPGPAGRRKTRAVRRAGGALRVRNERTPTRGGRAKGKRDGGRPPPGHPDDTAEGAPPAHAPNPGSRPPPAARPLPGSESCCPGRVLGSQPCSGSGRMNT